MDKEKENHKNQSIAIEVERLKELNNQTIIKKNERIIMLGRNSRTLKVKTA